MKKICLVVLIISLLAIMVQADQKEDILQKILTEAGFTKSDIGYQPKGYWNRFPLDTPYRLTSFDALFADPFKLPDYATVMANTVEYYMEPMYADSNSDGLYKLVYNLGVDKKLGGFRSYSANLLPAPNSDTPLQTAVEQLYALAGEPPAYSTFGTVAEYPPYKIKIQKQMEKLPDSVETVIAELIVNLGEAIRWRNLAFRKCDPTDMQKVFAIRDLADTQNDGTKYYPEMDDIAQAIDFSSLHYSALKVASATEQAELKLQKLKDKMPNDFRLEFKTPFGTVAIFSKTKQNPFIYNADNSLLIIDFGNNNLYTGSAGATSSLLNPISVLIDLGGNDQYGSKNESAPTTGVGLLGVGLVIDSKGNDMYNGSIYAQGAGLFGVGVLYDREGNDKYKSSLSSQGCGYFGIGLCFDGTGDDEYYIHGSGQGLGGVGGGIGVCASYSGNDKYTAEPFSDVFNRGDYHSKNKINGNEAQGAGFGRRGDGSDGHAWAGGLGAIIDIDGNDYYYSGNWSLGVGYWFGTGIAIDRRGDDIYKSCYFTQGSGAHFCNGILLDENGNDRHELFETAGAALGFGWDYTNAFLINKNGNDIYRAKMISMGLSQIRSNSFFIDIGGDDSYYLGKGTPGLGEATYRKDYEFPSKLTPYYYYAKSFGGFIDIGGNDRYFDFTDSTETVSTEFINNSLWFQPSKTDSTFGANNYGVGIDVEDGTVPELFLWGDEE
ncbi:MAG TPA: hypothetical protein ENH23_04120 [candidate division Zixibacteria bacterium]|nr:hypothetical protein [candidate division Zixibacteria bacterium]